VIITRTPLRISIGGSGTDPPSCDLRYYGPNGGFLISAAINRYAYIAINDTFTDDYVIKYSAPERFERVDDIAPPPRSRGAVPPPDRRRQRDRQHRRHTGRRRPGLVGGVHRGAPAGAVRPNAREGTDLRGTCGPVRLFAASSLADEVRSTVDCLHDTGLAGLATLRRERMD
jgi:hypothetical protein